MKTSDTVYLHVWTGNPDKARALVRNHRPGSPAVELSHNQLRSGGWRGQLRSFRKLRGQALVVFFESLQEAPQLQLVLWSGLIHQCRETIVADESGEFRAYRRKDWIRLLPQTVASVIADTFVLFTSLMLLRFWKMIARPLPFTGKHDLDVAYLFPYPLIRNSAGGAMSHIRGVLGGMASNGASCEIFSGTTLPAPGFHTREIPAQRRLFLFWESLMLTYSICFARAVRRMLGAVRPSMLYQRHGRFSVAGALLSTWMQVPLVLEYNGSELWMARYWDPTRFRRWLELCEDISVACASRIVVVSEALRDQLLARGIPQHRILINPNAVDPEHFHPGCGGNKVRQDLQIAEDEIVVGFVGTFGPWHGVLVLQQAIELLLQSPSQPPLRFLLIGNGPLQQDVRKSLQSYESSGRVIFSGIVPHDRVRSYLDAADILVSPHVPMPDGRPFFGSPTKLFEYMAMGKAIVASNLDQLSQVLSHNQTAVLVEPGDVTELANAILLLARDPALRIRLGKQARLAAMSRHTWKQNAALVLNSAQSRQQHGLGVLSSSPLRKRAIDTGVR